MPPNTKTPSGRLIALKSRKGIGRWACAIDHSDFDKSKISIESRVVFPVSEQIPPIANIFLLLGVCTKQWLVRDTIGLGKNETFNEEAKIFTATT